MLDFQVLVFPAESDWAADIVNTDDLEKGEPDSFSHVTMRGGKR